LAFIAAPAGRSVNDTESTFSVPAYDSHGPA
jgi:hypothetical protein